MQSDELITRSDGERREFDFTDTNFDRVRKLIYDHAGISLSPSKREMVYSRLGRRLPDGQTLTIAVLDLDLAGSLRPTPTGELRVLRGGADWPSMSLRYTLQADGRTLASIP